jgi:hypothetical protein
MPFRSVTPLAILGVLTGCFLATEPSDSLLLEVAVEPRQFRIGDTATIVVTLENPTSDTIRFETDQCGVFFSIENADGRAVAPINIGCPGRALIAFAPGADSRWEYWWFGEPVSYRRPEGRPYPSEYLPPGTYTVRAVLSLPFGLRHSEPVAVELLPRQ